MNTVEHAKTVEDASLKLPSAHGLWLRLLAAAAVAAVIVVCAVLPAEYHIDPTGIGKLTGLMNLSQAGPAAQQGEPAKIQAPVQVGVYTAQPATYKVDSEDLSLLPGDGVEIKYHMQKGAGMVYAWKANGKVNFEFHGEPDVKPNKEYYESYELNNNGKDSSYGSFTAPSTGIHGWFWENKSSKQVDLHLTTAGFYDSAKMMAGDTQELTIQDAK